MHLGGHGSRQPLLFCGLLTRAALVFFSLEQLDGLANLIRQRGRRLDQVQHFHCVELEKHASDLAGLRRVGGGYELVQLLAEDVARRASAQLRCDAGTANALAAAADTSGDLGRLLDRHPYHGLLGLSNRQEWQKWGPFGAPGGGC
jgi:hypothetical protein